ncbi:hypothetical protein J6590_059593 [Homalodisca vitripennis]|nr:hypothetical protein J6590_059593 [Homalodisca vitripennis]
MLRLLRCGCDCVRLRAVGISVDIGGGGLSISSVNVVSRAAYTIMNGPTSTPFLSVPSVVARRNSALRRGSAALTVADSKGDVSDYRRVMVLYTGGTIGMVRNDDGDN